MLECESCRSGASTQSTGKRLTMMWGNYGSMGWGWAIGGVVVILVVATTVVGAVRMAAKSRSTMVRPSPKEILDERLASGELTLDQYRDHLNELEKNSS
jgi:uncharacterized membrane protein